MRETVERYFAAVNTDSFVEAAAVLAHDVEIHAVGARPVVGRAAALEHLPKVVAPYAEHHDRVTRWIEAPGAVVAEIDFVGRLRDGRPVAFAAVDVFDLRDDLITKVFTWYDSKAVARQVSPPRDRIGLHHLGVRARDLEKSIEFYRALGAEMLAPPRKVGRQAAAISMTVDAATTVRMALLGFPGGNGVELFSFEGDVPSWCIGPDPAARLPHLGIQVTDVDAALARAESLGGQRLWDEPGYFGPVRVVYLRDPDGMVLELLDGPLAAVAGALRR